MPVFLRLLLAALAGALIVGARLANQHCVGAQPTELAAPAATHAASSAGLA